MQTIDQLKKTDARYQEDELHSLFKFLKILGAVLFAWGVFSFVLSFISIGSDYGYLAYKYFSYHARGMHVGVALLGVLLISSKWLKDLFR